MKQALYPDYLPRFCPYCGGRGFFLTRRDPDKIVTPDVVVECKFCGGTGERSVSKP